MNIMEHCRGKVSARCKRPWFDMQKNYYFHKRDGVQNLGELKKALEHYQINLSNEQLQALFEFFLLPSPQIGFDFKLFGSTLFPRGGGYTDPKIRAKFLFDTDYSNGGFGLTYDTDMINGLAGTEVPTSEAEAIPVRRTFTSEYQTANMHAPVMGEYDNARLGTGKRGTTSFYVECPPRSRLSTTTMAKGRPHNPERRRARARQRARSAVVKVGNRSTIHTPTTKPYQAAPVPSSSSSHSYYHPTASTTTNVPIYSNPYPLTNTGMGEGKRSLRSSMPLDWVGGSGGGTRNMSRDEEKAIRREKLRQLQYSRPAGVDAANQRPMPKPC